MNTHTDVSTHLARARALSDEKLLARVKTLAVQARQATAELVAHLAEVETRDLHLASGYSSMFKYCREALHLSEHEAYHRIAAARAARRFPVVLDRLAEGAVNLTTVELLGRHLTAENHAEVLESARGRSKSEVEQIVARLAPAPDVPMSVRKVTTPAVVSAPAPPPTSPEPCAASTPLDGLFATIPTNAVSPTTTPLAPKPAAIKALSPDRYKLQLTIGGDTLEKLRLAKDILRHAIRSGDEGEIIDRALTMLLADLAKKKFAATERPGPSRGVAIGPGEGAALGELIESRYIPAEVKRVVFVRDLGRCAFVSKDGRRCHERGCLEFHHVRPYAEGGLPTVDNIELRCRGHNGYEWRVRSTHVRVIEEKWLGRQVAATTRSGASQRPPQGRTASAAGLGSGAGIKNGPSAPHSSS
jgi:hypothetical protein